MRSNGSKGRVVEEAKAKVSSHKEPTSHPQSQYQNEHLEQLLLALAVMK